MITIEAKQKATHAFIWLHGLGADSNDMVQLVETLAISSLPIRHVFLQAPTRRVTLNNGYAMPAWYDITGLRLIDREDEDGILASEKIIIEQIEQQKAKGVTAEKIFLAGFSQGGAMSLFTALRFKQTLGGVVALSCYLPLASWFKKTDKSFNVSIPIFIAIGDLDPMVNPAWGEASFQQLQAIACQSIEKKHYPMAHCVCEQELHDIKQWIEKNVVG